MKALKSLFGKDKKRSKTPGLEKEAFLRPALSPGYYGAFPATFGLHFLGRSQDKKADYYIIGLDHSGASVQPLYAVTVHKGTVKHQVTLHAGPNHSDAALGLAGAEKLFRSMSLVALPAPAAGSGDSAPTAVNDIVQLSPQKSLKYDNFNFSSVVGSGAREDFEWRSDNVLKPPPKGKLYERTLVRVRSGNGAEETVGRWTDDAAPEKTAKLGTFAFEGSGATGELGSYWGLMAVMTLLRITQIKLEASAAADKMLSAAAKVMLTGAGMGMGA
ncbi:hypothetical protein QQS21_006207 [Conoideocrella luteorostrata]|uniref:Uncharacterized protein n=1 Tax=Conoideocrella luteorostrata TaxID=1105319 RepID=A0AAJ0CS72_9HYPO|nr:hypothetical protein QQS21_006207 [Conoideocrella luteorostrata]